MPTQQEGGENVAGDQDVVIADRIQNLLSDLNKELNAAGSAGLFVDIDYAIYDVFGHRYPLRHYNATFERRFKICPIPKVKSL
jgi:hypothetical protein